MKVETITIVSDKGKAQTLTLEEAKELYESLHEIFGENYSPSISPIGLGPYIIPSDAKTVTTTTECQRCKGKGCDACSASWEIRDGAS